MPLRMYNCKECGLQLRTFSGPPTHCEKEMSLVLTAVSSKFMEPRDSISKERGKSVIKNQDKIMKERTRNHSRDHELDDLIQTNDDEGIAAGGWKNAAGTKRRKIDDL